MQFSYCGRTIKPCQLIRVYSPMFCWLKHNDVYNVFVYSKFGRHQSKFIKEIVKHIMGRHQDAHMSASIFPPRIDSGIEYLNLLLTVISDDVLIIGICGMDKTSIAKTVYNQNFLRFEASSFLSNVSKIAEKPDGLVVLQKQLISERGTLMLKRELCSKRILVVLDGANKLEQLHALARKCDWFGSIA
jgi:hypothetical protein